jgi:hypothetical protein
MISLVLLLAGSTLAAPPGNARHIPLRLESGQEFIYHANYTQKCDRTDSAFSRYLDVYVLILDASPPVRAAFMTVQYDSGRSGAEAVPIVRIESARIDALGRVSLETASNLPRLPIDGPPTLETTPFLEMPAVIPPDNKWQIPDADWGAKTWSVLREEKHELGWSWKLQAVQDSGDQNIVGRLVWNRKEAVWLLQNEGIVVRAERNTEWKTAGGELFHSTCVIALDSIPAPLPAGQFDARCSAIRDVLHYQRDLAELMLPRGEPNLRGYNDLCVHIDHHQRRGTPYDLAFDALRRRVEAARNGERPPEPIVIPARYEPLPIAPRGSAADVNQLAPDVLLRDGLAERPISLSSLRGEPVVLLFFECGSDSVERMVRYARRAAYVYAGRVHVVLLATNGEPSDLQKLRGKFNLDMTIHDGRDILPQFAGRSAPRVVVIDDRGVIRMIAPGWKEEYSDSIFQQLVKILRGK